MAAPLKPMLSDYHIKFCSPLLYFDLLGLKNRGYASVTANLLAISTYPSVVRN